MAKSNEPRRCGRAREPGHVYYRGAPCADDYQARISGPLIDRIDLHIEVDPLLARDLALPPLREDSADISVRVAQARATQRNRFDALQLPTLRSNAEADGEVLEQIAWPDAAGLTLLGDAADTMDSVRGDIKGFCRWRIPWPILKPVKPWAGFILPKRLPSPPRRMAPGIELNVSSVFSQPQDSS